VVEIFGENHATLLEFVYNNKNAFAICRGQFYEKKYSKKNRPCNDRLNIKKEEFI